jgi:hypothetical protein
MSVTFSVEGERHELEEYEKYLNFSNQNTQVLLDWLGVPHDHLYGSIKGTELAAKCRRRLWPESRNVDVGTQTEEEYDGRLIRFGRPPGYLPERTAQLLQLAERAGEKNVVFG